MFAAADRASTRSDRSDVNADPDSSWIRSDASTLMNAKKEIRAEVVQGKQLAVVVVV